MKAHISNGEKIIGNFYIFVIEVENVQNPLLDENAPKPSFIREVLEKCRRFCYHQRIVETVPQDFEHLLPNEPNIR